MDLGSPEAKNRSKDGSPKNSIKKRRDTRILVRDIFTEERKLEVPPRETLRMSDTLGYIWYSFRLYREQAARARHLASGGFCDFDFCRQKSI